ncbi:MAG TPA: PRD domain-containing protein [Candidatus Paenibacillus intestinavium]|nr:PRD domain-containing protein [Candidatus Paenibacillus intestinavium]
MSKDGLLKIDRIVGNNVILTSHAITNKEYVLFGKGLGFTSKGNQCIHIHDPQIERRYRLDEEQPSSQFQALIENIDPQVIHISEQIIDKVKERLGTPVQPKVYFALPNHIQFVIYRLKNEMDIINPFLAETRLSFPQEYEIATEAVDMINEHFQLKIPEDEIGFLTLHIHTCTETVTVGQLVKVRGLLNQIVDYIEDKMELNLPRTSTDYVRLVTHLRGALERIIEGQHILNPFTSEIKALHSNVYEIAVELAEIIKEELKVNVSEDEIGYMAIHLYRLFQIGLFTR